MKQIKLKKLLCGIKQEAEKIAAYHQVKSIDMNNY